tara:strand:+ start:186630 stop:187127 length:498 start_codon:yes stop_codon:yes gene_type:complete
MSRRLPVEDTKPWYRQFWPWFLIALPGTVVIAGFYTLYIAILHSDDLVVDEYYKDGLAINQQLEKKERAQSLGVSASLHFDGDEVIARTKGPVTAGQLTLLMSHPLESNRDFETILISSAPGEYRGRLAQPIAARWHWTLKLDTPDGWRLDSSVTAADVGNANQG